MLLASASTLKRKHPWIYVLACEKDTFYVGFSRYLHHRLQAHFSGCGAHFTRRFSPKRVLELRPARSEKDEFLLWKIYAERYGVRRVGGWNETLAKQFGFDWPRLAMFRKAEYSPLGQGLFRPAVVDLSILSL